MRGSLTGKNARVCNPGIVVGAPVCPENPTYPGQPGHPEVVKTMQEITRRIRQAGRTMQSDVMQGAWVSDMLLDAGCLILSP
jgi:2-keto-3-deoxy-L-rhamnonate aldolase RhmA